MSADIASAFGSPEMAKHDSKQTKIVLGAAHTLIFADELLQFVGINFAGFNRELVRPVQTGRVNILSNTI